MNIVKDIYVLGQDENGDEDWLYVITLKTLKEAEAYKEMMEKHYRESHVEIAWRDKDRTPAPDYSNF